MAVHFHPLRVKNVHKETDDCVIITFDIPESLKVLFHYVHGQNITLKKNIDGEEIRRSYSICSAPFENKLSVAVKKVERGKFSTFANTRLQKGDILEVLPPTGKFNTPLKAGNEKNYLAFAVGSGITPIISIIKTTLDSEPSSGFTLVYGNRSRGSIIFIEELAGLKNKYPDRFNFINILSRENTEAPINFGRIDSEKLAELEKLVDYTLMDETFICGPQKMLFSVKSFLGERGVAPNKIHFELFNTPGSVPDEREQSTPAENRVTKSKITIHSDGRRFDFWLAFNGESILDAALKQGVDLPYACKGGVCCTCRAQLIEGDVKMDVNYALEAEELARGSILTCQSHPLTAGVVVDFDSR
ncbi:MAG: 1,2-phenylacetyl-CoA epoxidase subunit PaaE [Ferruginibacter sp.]